MRKSIFAAMLSAALCFTCVDVYAGNHHGGYRQKLVLPDLTREASAPVENPFNDQVDLLFNLRDVANFGYNDRVEGDKLDGWSCRCHDNDQRNCGLNRMPLYAGVPFDTINTDLVDAKTCIGLKAATYPQGVETVDFAVPENSFEQPAYLYLLHSYVSGEAVEDGIVAGKIRVTDKDGKETVLDVVAGRDIQVQRRIVFGDDLENAKVACWWRSTHSQVNCFCTSKFALGVPLNSIAAVELLASDAEGAPAWMVEGVTLSARDIELQSVRGEVTIVEDEHWKPMQLPKNGQIIAGSALDVSKFFNRRPVDETGRVLIRPDGQMVFECDVNTPVRFFSSVTGFCLFWGEHGDFNNYPGQIDTKENAELRCQELCRQGYNMERLHCLDSALIANATEPGVPSPQAMEMLDYYVYCLKKYGIYLNTDVAVDPSLSDVRRWQDGQTAVQNCKSRIYFDPEIRELWLKWVKNVFCHVNPYTGMTLLEDPVTVAIIGYNEQEYAFEDDYDAELVKPFFQKFLAQRYENIDALNAAWKGTEGEGNFGSFEEIPCFTPDAPRSTSVYGGDVARFIQSVETETQEFFKKTLRDLGYKGAFTNYNVGKTLHYNVAHGTSDAVQANTYHAHPSRWIFPTSAVNQDSTAIGANDIFRWTIIAKQDGKPLLNSEYQICFWQKHRYELPFAMGAYAAFQNLGGITAFAESTVLEPDWLIRPFLSANDPVSRAGELLNCLLFRRGDVSPAEGKMRLMIDPQAVYDEIRGADSISPELTRFSLVTGFASDVARSWDRFKPQQLEFENTLMGVKTIANTPLIARDVDFSRSFVPGITLAVTGSDRKHWAPVLPEKGKLDPDKLLNVLKDECIIDDDNATSFAQQIFESDTKELYLDCARELYAIDTPQYQGIAAPENTLRALTDVDILKNTTRGAISVVSIDGDKPIVNANRLLVAYTTNCYNEGTRFGDSWKCEILWFGRGRILCEVGDFEVAISNDNAKGMKAYALGLDGARLSEVPVQVDEDGKLHLAVNTAELPNGPSVFFELAVD